MLGDAIAEVIANFFEQGKLQAYAAAGQAEFVQRRVDSLLPGSSERCTGALFIQGKLKRKLH